MSIVLENIEIKFWVVFKDRTTLNRSTFDVTVGSSGKNSA
jgi:hypothetical protein